MSKTNWDDDDSDIKDSWDADSASEPEIKEPVAAPKKLTLAEKIAIRKEEEEREALVISVLI